MSCNRCKGTTTDPHNFLLCCSECGKNWHHRCHIPPLSDSELTALLRATNNNDVDNGLSSWIGKCCKKKRARAQATPEAQKSSTRSGPSVSVVEIPQRHSSSVPAAPKIPVYAAPVSQQGTSSLSVPKHSTPHLDEILLSNDVATPQKQDDGPPIGHLSLHKPATGLGSQTTSVVPELPYPQAPPKSAPSQSDMVAKDDQSLRSTPLPSTSSSTRFDPPSFGNQSSTFVLYSRPSHLREGLMQAFERIPTSQLVEPTHAQGSSQLRKPSPVVTGPSHASTAPRPMDIDPPTLDLRALSLNRAPGPSKAPSRLLFHRVTTSRDPSPPPPLPPPPTVPSVKAEDDDMEDLYAPPINHPSTSARPPPQRRERPQGLSPPSPSLQYPEESGPLVLPALAARDPRILAFLERHERREAARPRQGMRKVQAVRGAGKKRGRVVLVPERTDAETAQAAEVSRRAITRSHQCIISFLESLER